MKIIVQAEQKLYMDVEVEVPDELIKNIDEVPNMTNVNISDWLDQNFKDFEWSKYDSDLNWTKWIEVEVPDQVVNQVWAAKERLAAEQALEDAAVDAIRRQHDVTNTYD
tara:strand:+ start:49 stop:375 length:327 start_codon:yes stop_codon:yes gene_type:complete